MTNDNQTPYDPDVYDMLEQAEQLKAEGNFDAALEILNHIILDQPECYEAYEEIGDNLLSLRKVARAERALQQALKRKPDSANAHYLMGFLYSLQQRWDHSIQELEEADKLFPNHPEILRCLGWAIYNSSRRAQGIAVLERSQSLSPGDLNIMCDLGVCHMNNGHFEDAHKQFEKIIKKAPDSDQADEAKSFLQMLEGLSNRPSEEA